MFKNKKECNLKFSKCPVLNRIVHIKNKIAEVFEKQLKKLLS